ncbi:MAG: response regulator [candidate division WOR-3 bacterium]
MKRILIVDDDESIRMIFKKVLENSGYEVETASSGIYALSILEKEKFDVYIIDLKMPEMDGITLLEEIKKRGYEGIPIILTAYGDKESAVSALKLGAYDFVEKPISINDLKFSIQRAIEKKALIEENIRLKEYHKINRIIDEIFNFFDEEEFLKNFPRILVSELNFESAMIYIYKPLEKVYFYPRFIPEIEKFIDRVKEESFLFEDVYMFQKISPDQEIQSIVAVKSFFPLIEREIETFRVVIKQGEIFWKHLILKEKLKDTLDKLKAYHLSALKTGRVSVIGEISNFLIKNFEEPLKDIEIALSFLKSREDLRYLKETEEIFRALNDLKRMLNNFKGIMQSLPLQRKKTKIGELINICYEILLPNFKDSKVSFWREGLEEVEIDAFESLLEHVFIHLFLNSLDAMKEGGELRVKISEEEDIVKIEVMDTGYGISPKIRDKIFEPFFTTKKDGLGLGLFFVKNAVEMHGGKIYFESEEGVGTTFYIILPKRWEGL